MYNLNLNVRFRAQVKMQLNRQYLNSSFQIRVICSFYKILRLVVAALRHAAAQQARHECSGIHYRNTYWQQPNTFFKSNGQKKRMKYQEKLIKILLTLTWSIQFPCIVFDCIGAAAAAARSARVQCRPDNTNELWPLSVCLSGKAAATNHRCLGRAHQHKHQHLHEHGEN